MKKNVLKHICVALSAVMIFMCACTTKNENDNAVHDKETKELNAIFPGGEKGPAKNFTGNAFNTNLIDADSVFTTAVGNVYFEPGARSNWHTHPAGQILIITDGVGYHQIEGQPVDTIRKGDIVKCPPNVRHWHGASATIGLHQLYIVPNTEKGIVNWQEEVSDEIYFSKK